MASRPSAVRRLALVTAGAVLAAPLLSSPASAQSRTLRDSARDSWVTVDSGDPVRAEGSVPDSDLLATTVDHRTRRVVFAARYSDLVRSSPDNWGLVLKVRSRADGTSFFRVGQFDGVPAIEIRSYDADLERTLCRGAKADVSCGGTPSSHLPPSAASAPRAASATRSTPTAP